MSNYQKLYWLTRLDNFNSLFATLLILSILAFVLIVIFRLAHSDGDSYNDNVPERQVFRKRMGWHLYWLPFSALFFGLMWVFTPTKNDVVFIIAGGATLDYIQTDTSLQKLPYQTTKFVSEYLDKKIAEIGKQ